MEDDKKKRKNKKKKANKQTKTPEDDATVAVIAAAEEDATEIRHLQSPATLQPDLPHPAKSAVIRDEAEKQLWLQREAYLEKKIGDLQHVKDAWFQEADLEKKISGLQHEKDVWFQKEADLEKKVRDLQHEKDAWFQEEVSMEEKIKQLFLEKSNWALKEAQFVERMEQLERERESWVLEEMSIKETITKLKESNVDTRMQVKVLQESRDTVFQENQQLVGTISALQSQIQLLESSLSASSMKKTNISEVEDLKAQLEAAGVFVEKLIEDNAELVEKVNDLCIELNRLRQVLDQSSTAVPDPVGVISQTMLNGSNGDHVSEFEEKMSGSGNTLEYQLALQTKNENIDFDHTINETNTVGGFPNEESVRSYEAGDREEIVQIPLNLNEIEEVESVSGESEEGVTLSDAPLTGAPFRLISFVARYVSGADLVDDKKTLNSARW